MTIPLLMLCVLAAGAPAQAGAPSAVPAATPALPDDYAIGKQDLLEVSVFEVDQLNRTVRVSEDGTISLPLLGAVKVHGRTREEVELEIARRLAEGYVRNPQVTVFVREFQSRKVTVSGAVNKPGSYEMLGPRSLLEMIAEAGGLTDEVGKKLYVVRSGPDGADKERVPIDLEDLLYQGDQSLNVDLRPGDIIYAPFEEKIDIYVNGAVRNPGVFEFRRSELVTVLQAVTRAGGSTERANEKKVHVIRKSDDMKIILPVNLKKVKQGKEEDVVLLKDDIVVVPESFF